MDQPRILEEGLARGTTSDFPISPTDTLCNSTLPEASEKERGEASYDEIQEEQQPCSGWLSQFWRKGKTVNGLPSCADGMNPTVLEVRSLEKFPDGYPNLAAFTSSDESFMIYRSFSYLQARILLFKQDEMRTLEEQLDALDAEDKNEYPDALYMRLSDEGRSHERRELLSKIETKYLEYAQFLNTAHQLAALNKPGSGEYESVSHYLTGMKPVERSERSYINHVEDLVTLRPGREHAWLDTAIEKLLKLFKCRLLDYLFCDELTRRKTNRPEGAYYSRNRIEKCAVAVITAMILALLVIPIYVLYQLVSTNLVDGALDGHTNAICIGVLLVFTLAFSAMMSMMTRAKRHEILGAAAAYCAVLVVFFGNVGSN